MTGIDGFDVFAFVGMLIGGISILWALITRG